MLVKICRSLLHILLFIYFSVRDIFQNTFHLHSPLALLYSHSVQTTSCWTVILQLHLLMEKKEIFKLVAQNREHHSYKIPKNLEKYHQSGFSATFVCKKFVDNFVISLILKRFSHISSNFGNLSVFFKNFNQRLLNIPRSVSRDHFGIIPSPRRKYFDTIPCVPRTLIQTQPPVCHAR